jgi:hypothetical protein
MGKIVQGVVLVLNFAFTIVLCYLYDMNKWIALEKTNVIDTIDHHEGFFRQCSVINNDQTACEDYDEWIFSPNFPSWIQNVSEITSSYHNATAYFCNSWFHFRYSPDELCSF